jgi:desulfoferrodoxin-like iron-binding protein
MKAFVCKKCGHVVFDQAPVECFVCKAPIENFEENPEAIKIPADPKNLNDIEKRHIPVITISERCDLIKSDRCIDIYVKVGEIEHLMDSEHYITFIDFYLNKRYLARINFTYKRLHPAVSLHLNINSGIITVVENCIMHGNWMAQVEV